MSDKALRQVITETADKRSHVDLSFITLSKEFGSLTNLLQWADKNYMWVEPLDDWPISDYRLTWKRANKPERAYQIGTPAITLTVDEWPQDHPLRVRKEF